MKAPKFAYARVATVPEALQLLEKYGNGAQVLAGGQSLMPTLNMRLSQPEILVDINRLDGLRGISLDGARVRIGALTRHVDVLNSPVVAEHLPLIAEAMPHVAHVAVRNRGTFGGSVALSDPAAEMPACVLALGAMLVVESTNGRREIAAEDYFLQLYETARAPNELLAEILIPVQKPSRVSVFMELAQRQGDFAIAGLACVADIDGTTVKDIRLVYFASEDKPTLATGAMEALSGREWSDNARNAAFDALAGDLNPMENLHGGRDTKLHLQRVLTGRALDLAVERAGGA